MNSDGDVQAWVAPQEVATSYLGPRLGGRMFSLALYGVSFTVCSRYFMSRDFSMDSMFARMYIMFVMAMNTACTVMIGLDTALKALAQERTRAYFAIGGVNTCLYDYFYFATIIPTQFFLARRALALTVHAETGCTPRQAFRRRRPVVVATALLIPLFVALIGYIADLVLDTKLAVGIDDFSTIEDYGFIIAMSASALTDVVVSSTLGWHWVGFLRGNQGFNPGTDSLLRRLIGFTLATAMFTTIPACLAAILMGVRMGPEGDATVAWYTIFSDLLPQLYAISLFTTLNLRQSLRDSQPFQLHGPTPPTLRVMSSAAFPDTPHSSDESGEERNEGFVPSKPECGDVEKGVSHNPQKLMMSIHEDVRAAPGRSDDFRGL